MVYTVHGIVQTRILEWVAFPFSRGSSQSRDQIWSPALQANSSPAEPPGKPAMQETWVWSLDWEDPLEEAWQPTPVFLPRESPWTEEPGGLQFTGLQRVRHNCATKHNTTHMSELISKLCLFHTLLKVKKKKKKGCLSLRRRFLKMKIKRVRGVMWDSF